jgi:hypothetical protein
MWMLKTIAFCLLAVGLVALEIRLLASDQGRPEEVNSLRLTINANGKYIYPHHQNTFALYPSPHAVRLSPPARTWSKSSPPTTSTPSS